MASKEKLAKKLPPEPVPAPERVPDALFAALSCARANALDMKASGEEAIKRFAKRMQEKVSVEVKAMEDADRAIGEALGFKPGDSYDPRTGIVTRAK